MVTQITSGLLSQSHPVLALQTLEDRVSGVGRAPQHHVPTPRCGGGDKPNLSVLPTMPAHEIEGLFVRDGSLFLECRLHEIFDGFDHNSLITGTVVAAHVHEDAKTINSGSREFRRCPCIMSSLLHDLL